ncbi:unnamed protein product [Mytilus coruscus]|uniref:B box-type domain-containing protein n=1 Tax=Mytilus coruscus TaxID=42192 RepID=A0A6J8B4K4_MYTCO|nr:unnamed protein product [Mytilus coruscus]
MTSPNVDICTFYYDEGIMKTAITWCPECQVFLCTDCEKHHNKSEDHKTISSKEYSTLPSFMQELRSQCGDHKKKYEFYCSFHACPCCVHCVTDKHQKCQEMKPLSDILKQVKSSASVHLLDKDLKDVNEKYEEIRKYLNSRKNTNNIQKIKAIEKIQSMRRKIDDFLNKNNNKFLKS